MKKIYTIAAIGGFIGVGIMVVGLYMKKRGVR